MLEILKPIAIDAGEVKAFALGGQYIEIIDAVDPVDITLVGPAGQTYEMRGVSAGSFSKEAYTNFLMKSATAQTVRLLIASREGGTRRLSGLVSVAGAVLIDGYANGKAAKTFTANSDPQSLSGLTTSAHYIINPVGSGKTYAVKTIDQQSVNAATLANLPRLAAVRVGTIAGTFTGGLLPAVASNMAGAADSLLLMSKTTTGLAISWNNGLARKEYASGAVAFKFDEGLILPPGSIAVMNMDAIGGANGANDMAVSTWQVQEV